jgi:peptidoglycan/LPS O-acetylase OafA/YrhL
VGTTSRIPSLDGARAVSIMLVILSHMAFAGALPGAKYLMMFDLGNLGVRVFFVISGFIITHLLMKELDTNGTISLRDFYLRRAFRIMPAYYAFLAITALIGLSGLITIHYDEAPIAALYLSNYFDMHWNWGHTWSLAVEEQFYLLWPWALVRGRKSALYVSVAILIAAPLFRAASGAGLWPTNPIYAFECVADALATGCLLALLREQLWNNRAYRTLLQSPLFLALPILVFGGKALYQNPAFWDIAKVPLFNLCIAICLDRYMRLPQLALGRVLNWRPVVWTGMLSYSLYLWQQVFSESTLPFPLTLACIFCAAAASYYGIEQPFLRLRGRSTLNPRAQIEVAKV